MRHLAVTVSRSRGLVTVTLDGELDRTNATDVRAAVRAAGRLATHTVVLDAQGVTFVDAVGRRALDLVRDAPGPQVILLASNAVRSFDRNVAHTATAA